MTRYLVTAWCDRQFYAQCEVDAETPQDALEMARSAIHDAPAEGCDQGYHWDEWRVDTEEAEGVLLHLDESAKLSGAAAGLLAFAARIARMTQDGEEIDGKEFVMENDDAVDTLNALIDGAPPSGRRSDLEGVMSKTLPPDPDNLNNDRAAWAGSALATFMQVTGTDEEDAVGDLLADLMHWCDRHNHDFDLALERARGHYQAETNGEEAA